MSRLLALLLLAPMALAAPAFAGPRALFDNAHAEQAGQADWVIDDDQPVPLPAQGGIGPATLESFWTGGISAFGVALVKRGYTVHTNPTAITYGNVNNAYDLSNYDVFIVPEPNTLFSAAEKTAILSFVREGGGLIGISDHGLSDRNNDCYDSPMIWNDLDPTHLLGVHFAIGIVCGTTAEPNNNISQPSTNVNTAASDSITHGPMGVVTGVPFYNGTTFTLYPGSNPTVRGELWMNGLAQTSLTGVMAASCQYGSGRVFFIGDSSPLDDGTGTPGNALHTGWTDPLGTDSTIFVNATLWAARRNGPPRDSLPPIVAITSPVGNESWIFGATHLITWSATDNVGVASVTLAYSTSGGGGPWLPVASGQPNTGTYAWAVPAPATTQALVRVTALDAAGNAVSDSSAAWFSILDPSAGVNADPAVLSLARPMPNPSGNFTTIAFSLPGEAHARLQVLDAGGRRVATLEDTFGAGHHLWQWDGRNRGGARVRAGLYFVRLSTPYGERLRRLVRLD